MYRHFFYTIQSAFWGYRKSQVDNHISKIYRSNRRKLSELSRRLEELEEKRRQLEMTSLDLKRDITRYSAGYLPVDLLVEIFEGMDGFKQSQPEEAAVQKTFDDTELTKTIHVVEDTVKQELGILSWKVDAMVDMLKNIISTKNHSEESPINFADIKENSKHKEALITEAPVNKKPEPVTPAANMGKVLNFSRISTALKQNAVEKKAVPKQESAFWGNAVNGYRTSDIVSSGIDTQEILDYVNRTVNMVPFNSFFDSQRTEKKEIKAGEIAAVLENRVNTSPVFQQPDKAADERENESLKQNDIDENARYIRQKYITGKVAGQDLFDRSGNLIIRKSSKITSEAIVYADKEGKLPELIINMILPDLE